MSTFISRNGSEWNIGDGKDNTFTAISVDMARRTANRLRYNDERFAHTTSNVDAFPATYDDAFSVLREHAKLLFAARRACVSWAVDDYINDISGTWSYRDLYSHMRECDGKYKLFFYINVGANPIVGVFEEDGTERHIPWNLMEDAIGHCSTKYVPKWCPITGETREEKLVRVNDTYGGIIPTVPFMHYVNRSVLEERGISICPNCGYPIIEGYTGTEVFDWETGEVKLMCNCQRGYTLRYCEYHNRYEMNTDFVTVEHDTWCEHAFQEAFDNLVVCETCEEYVREANAIFFTDDDGVEHLVCRSCYRTLMRNRVDWEHATGLLGYCTKPRAVFYDEEGHSTADKGLLYIGTEVELDQSHRENIDYNGGDKCAVEVMRHFKGEVYCKSDGSLEGGCECVTHPHTIGAFYNNFDWSGMFAIARANKLTANATCGMHTHLSRDAFGCTISEQNRNVAKLIMLMDEHHDLFFNLSRREDEDDYERWAGASPLEGEWCSYYNSLNTAYNDCNDDERYRAVNLCNEHTIEIRIWASTTDVTTAKVTMDMAASLVGVVKSHSGSEIYQWGDADVLRAMLDNAYNRDEMRRFFNRMGYLR